MSDDHKHEVEIDSQVGAGLIIEMFQKEFKSPDFCQHQMEMMIQAARDDEERMDMLMICFDTIDRLAKGIQDDIKKYKIKNAGVMVGRIEKPDKEQMQ